MSMRLVVVAADANAAAHVGGEVERSARSFDLAAKLAGCDGVMVAAVQA